MVAPPRGERGLKSSLGFVATYTDGRSPSWGAWIEIQIIFGRILPIMVAPPRGERGLKFEI